jgi:transposase
MAQNFLSCDREQDFLMPPSVREWLPAGHLAWFVLEVVERLDLRAIYAHYRTDGSGRPAHEPGMMVALLVYAYCVGERSSRRVERRCVEDVAFRVIAANRAPDHTTISRFRQRFAAPLAELFVQVLALCAKAGMVRVGTVAVDGTKLAANAGIGSNRTYEAIRAEVERMLAEADAVDAAEDELFGDARGDELPEELADPRSRRARLDQAQRELEAEHAQREAEYERLVAARAEYRARTGKNPRGRHPKPPDPGVLAAAKRNITDPESRIMTHRGAFLQAYNAQALVGEGRVIVAADVTADGNDSAQLAPMLSAARTNLHEIGHDGRIERVLADGGYWNHDQIHQLGADGTEIIVPTHDWHTRQRKQRPRQGPEADRIRALLDAKPGRALYRRRAELVEPVFAHTKHTRQITRFSRRGLTAARTEWALIAATHNLLKLFRHHHPQTA